MKLNKLISMCLALIFALSCAFTANAKAKVTVANPNIKSITEKLTCVVLKWKKDATVNGYKIYRSSDKISWTELISTADNTTTKFVDKTALADNVYYYAIKSYVKVKKKTYYSEMVDFAPVFFGTNFYISTYEDSVKLKWTVVSGATGYEVYYSEDKGEFKKIKNLKDGNKKSYTKKNITPLEKGKVYSFYIKAYKTENKKKSYIYTSPTYNSNSKMAIMNGCAGATKATFKCVNTQGKKAKTAYTVTVTEADKKIFKKFASEYLTCEMSPYYKIRTAFFFIHKNVTYATGSSYSKIDGCSYAKAIFTYKLGQCAQYNGAMAEYLAFLGVGSKLIWGYRGTTSGRKWQHFWGEAKLSNGKTYVVETGNFGQDGSWNYFFEKYSNTKKYLKCGEYISGIVV